VTTETKDRPGAAGDDILAELNLEAVAADAPDLDLDLDAVMNADPEAEPTGAASRYDFHRPRSISRRFEQNLQNIAELFARNATVNLTSLLRSNLLIEFQGIQLKSFAEYREALPRPTCLAVLALRPLIGHSLLHLDLALSFVILKRLMGGRPDSEDRVRPFTEIERGILGHFVGRLTEMLRSACAKLVEISPERIGLENNPDYVAGIPAGDTIAALRFRLRLEAVEGLLELTLPISAFAPVRDIFDPEEHVEARSREEMHQDRRQILDMIQSTASEVVVRMGELSLPLDRVLALREGDLLHLPQPVDAPLTVLVEGREVFLAEAGRINQNRAVKLVREIEKE